MKHLIYLIAPTLLLSSCNDDKAPAEVQTSVRANLPLYYSINSVKSEISEQSIEGDTNSLHLLTIDVTLAEDLYLASSLSEDLQKQLDETKPVGYESSNSDISDKHFLKKVASKGETKTIYGEFVSTSLIEGENSFEDLKIEDDTKVSGKPISAYNQDDVILVGTSEERIHVYTTLKKRSREAKLKQENQAAALKRKQLKQTKARALSERTKQIIQTFTVGKSYEGVYNDSTSENITVTISKFDTGALQGIFEIKKNDGTFATNINFAFKPITLLDLEKTRTYTISGANEPAEIQDDSLTKISRLAYNAYYDRLNPDKFTTTNDSITIVFGNDGELILKK